MCVCVTHSEETWKSFLSKDVSLKEDIRFNLLRKTKSAVFLGRSKRSGFKLIPEMMMRSKTEECLVNLAKI